MKVRAFLVKTLSEFKTLKGLLIFVKKIVDNLKRYIHHLKPKAI